MNKYSALDVYKYLKKHTYGQKTARVPYTYAAKIC